MIDAIKARVLWYELHLFQSGQKIDLDQQKTFFAGWLVRVENLLDCSTCFRKLKWFLSKWPVDYGEGFHTWGICLHDFVNKQLGRKLFYPEISLAPLTKHGIIQ